MVNGVKGTREVAIKGINLNVRCDRIRYGPFANYLQIACHKARIKEEMHAGHRIQIVLMVFDEIQIICMVLVHLHYVRGHEILNCTLIYSTVICHKRILRQNC